MWLYQRVMSQNDADGMANSVDPDQTAPLSESALFAQAYLSENLGSLWYALISCPKGCSYPVQLCKGALPSTPCPEILAGAFFYHPTFPFSH